MPMETIQAQSANTLSIPVKPQSGSIDPTGRNQQVPAQDTYIDQETSRPVQQAFDVQISSKAREQANAAVTDSQENTQMQGTAAPETQPAVQASPGRGPVKGSLVNLII